MSDKYRMDSLGTKTRNTQSCGPEKFSLDHVNLCDISDEVLQKYRRSSAHNISNSKIPGWQLATGLVWPNSGNTFLDRFIRVKNEKFYIVYDDIWEKVLFYSMLIAIVIILIEFIASQADSEDINSVIQHIGWKIFAGFIKSIPALIAAWKMFKRTTITSKKYLANPKVKQGFFGQTVKNLRDAVSARKIPVTPDLVTKKTDAASKKPTLNIFRGSPTIVPTEPKDLEYHADVEDTHGHWSPN